MLALNLSESRKFLQLKMESHPPNSILMKVRYTFPLKRPIDMDDHWPIPVLDGIARMVENDDGLVVAIEFAKDGCPVDLAFQVIETPGQISKATIAGQDGFVRVVQDHLDRAFSYLQCYFSTEIEVGSVDIEHIAETSEEEEKIVLPSFSIGKKEEAPLPLTYDFVTRAIMAAEEGEAPTFEASLAQLARENNAQGRYIDCFRYCFLLIEAIFGEGKFKKKQLEDALKGSEDFVAMVAGAIAAWQLPNNSQDSATKSLMEGSPSTDDVIEHLVERRGHYFHANLKKASSWSAKHQDEANALAWLALQISQAIAARSADKMFEDELAKRHFQEAGEMGAHLMVKIEYLFRVPEDEFIRKRQLNVQVPGTKPTTRIATGCVKQALEHFEKTIPVGRIHSVNGRDINGNDLFTVRIHTEVDGKIVEG